MANPLVAVELRGRTALVTGANSGIGWVTALELARAGARVWLACRSRDKAEAAMQAIRAQVPDANLAFLELNLGDLASVRQAAATFLATGEPLHLLVNNAGLAGQRGVTKDGFELHFGTNHLGPYLLTRLLAERVQQSAPARIVCVSSRAHYQAKQLDLSLVQQSTPTVMGLAEYAVSKLCNVLFAEALARRLTGKGVTVYALHPGVVASEIWRSIPQPFRWIALQFMITNEEGARTTLHCATAPELASETGLYYDKCKPRKASRLGRDEQLAEQLWQQSAAWAGLPDGKGL